MLLLLLLLLLLQIGLRLRLFCCMALLFVYLTKNKKTTKGKYVGYSESKYRLRIFRAHPRDCHFAHVT